MKIISMPRGSGKTTELIKLSAKSKDIIACFSMQECDRVFKFSKTLNYKIPKPITYDELLKPGINNKVGYMIDEYDKFCDKFIGLLDVEDRLKLTNKYLLLDIILNNRLNITAITE